MQYDSHYTPMHGHAHTVKKKMAEILHKIINNSYHLAVGLEVI